MSRSPSSSLPEVLLLTEPRFSALFDPAVFPHRLCMRRSTWSPIDVIVLFLTASLFLLKYRPRVMLLAGVSSSDKRIFDIVYLFTIIKRVGGIRNTKLILWSAKSYSTTEGRVIGSIDYNYSNTIAKFVTLYRSIEVNHPKLKKQFQFVPFPAWQINRVPPCTVGNYVFTGGEAQRDFASLLAAIDGLSIPFRLRTLGEGEEILRSQVVPSNCQVHIGHRWESNAESFIEDMLGSRFVVVPLFRTDDAKGLTMIVEALSLGKPVISTTSIGLSDYLEHGVNSLLVDAGDIASYRDSILKLWTDNELFNTLSTGARNSAKSLTKTHFLQCMIDICVEVEADLTERTDTN